MSGSLSKLSAPELGAIAVRGAIERIGRKTTLRFLILPLLLSTTSITQGLCKLAYILSMNL